MVLMGNLAVRNPNRLLLWDGEKMEVTNDKDANAYVRRRYSQGVVPVKPPSSENWKGNGTELG